MSAATIIAARQKIFIYQIFKNNVGRIDLFAPIKNGASLPRVKAERSAKLGRTNSSNQIIEEGKAARTSKARHRRTHPESINTDPGRAGRIPGSGHARKVHPRPIRYRFYIFLLL
ncbi:hypothetical protein [Thiobaca trueperi]|uniref:hypothetical protein n=1 Tax=Thiobaca trueperi TaxID=127458 RepID=UPI00104D0B14|nr:hypothetical protein [Thiobaca trueperi]